jgi:PAS domain S-box-containing protein
MPPHPLSQPLWREFPAQTITYALLLLDADGRVVGWSGAAERIFGYQEQEVLGTPVQRLFTPEDLEHGLDLQELELARRDRHAEDDRWHVRKDGTRIWVSGTVEAIRDSGGKVLGFVKVMRDRTDMRMAQEEVRHGLEAAAGSRDQMRAFVRTLGHEMRNTLAPLSNSAHILRRVGGDERTVRIADMIANQVGVLSRMAEDLMNVSRVESGQLEIRKERVDLCDVVESAVDGFKLLAQEHGVVIDSVLPPSPLCVQLDRQRFAQVLLNLVSNAIKYTPRGGEVWCTATREADAIVLRVQDTGIGIAPEVLPRIFDLFSREPEAAQREPTGLGIGLSVANAIVKLHGGTIQARSPGQGQGSEFSVRLPAADPA